MIGDIPRYGVSCGTMVNGACHTVGAASMVGHAADHSEQQEEGEHHEKAAPTASDYPANAITKTESKSVFD